MNIGGVENLANRAFATIAPCRRCFAPALTGFISTAMSRTSRRMFMSIAMTSRQNSGLIRCNWRQTLDFVPTNCADTINSAGPQANDFGGLE